MAFMELRSIVYTPFETHCNCGPLIKCNQYSSKFPIPVDLVTSPFILYEKKK